MSHISTSRRFFALALVVGSLGIGLLTVETSRAQTSNLLGQRLEVVLLDCGETANVFAVETISSTFDVGISIGMDCAAAVQKLLLNGFVLGPGAGGATSGDGNSSDHFLLIFFQNRNEVIEQSPAAVPSLPSNEPQITAPSRVESVTSGSSDQRSLTPIFRR